MRICILCVAIHTELMMMIIIYNLELLYKWKEIIYSYSRPAESISQFPLELTAIVSSQRRMSNFHVSDSNLIFFVSNNTGITFVIVEAREIFYYKRGWTPVYAAIRRLTHRKRIQTVRVRSRIHACL